MNYSKFPKEIKGFLLGRIKYKSKSKINLKLNKNNKYKQHFIKIWNLLPMSVRPQKKRTRKKKKEKRH